MHSFAPFWNPQSKSRAKKNLAKTRPRKIENERPITSSTLFGTSAKGGWLQRKKTARMKIELLFEYACDIWSPSYHTSNDVISISTACGSVKFRFFGFAIQRHIENEEHECGIRT